MDKFPTSSLLTIFIFLMSCTAQEEELRGLQFKLLSSDQTGIQFANRITENVATNFNLFDYDYFYFDYDYFYNGAGVGIADVDNDGLKDIFFAANQEPNKLYLNKGNMRFEDISEHAGINKNKYWSTGVTFVDINIFLKADRRMVKVFFRDIYYIESLKDYVLVKTKYEDLIVHHNMRSFMSLLPADEFLRIHRSHTISLRHIKALDGNQVEIKGKLLPIGRNYQQSVKSTILHSD